MSQININQVHQRISLSISFSIKQKLLARKGRLAKRNKTTLISLLSRGRATSADIIGREFTHLVWFGDPWRCTRIFSEFDIWPKI